MLDKLAARHAILNDLASYSCNVVALYNSPIHDSFDLLADMKVNKSRSERVEHNNSYNNQFFDSQLRSVSDLSVSDFIALIVQMHKKVLMYLQTDSK